MGCKKITYQNFSFLEVIHRKKATAKFIFGLNGDHLGNVRLSYTDANRNGSITNDEIVKENNYYPFGLLHQGYNNVIHPHGAIYNYGFNGKELQEENGIAWHDFGSRNFDAELGRWFNTDPKGQFGSPYLYAFNNPVTSIDPDGELAFTAAAIIGATFMGAWLGAATTAVGGGDFSDIGKNALIGGVAGLLSGGVASALTTASAGSTAIISGTGFWNGAAVGGGSGLAGGLASGSLAPALNGGDFGDIVGGGLKGGAIGGLTGAAMGGISGGIDAASNDGNFWTGEGTTHDYLVANTAQNNGEVVVGKGMDYSDEYGQAFSDLNFGEVEGMNCLKCDGTVAPGRYKTVGDRVYRIRDNREVFGTTIQTSNGHEVYIYKAAFTSPEQLYLTMGHEYLHVGYNIAGLGKKPFSAHGGIRRWEYLQAKQWGYRVNHFQEIWKEAGKPWYSPAYNHSKFGFKINKHLPKLPK